MESKSPFHYLPSILEATKLVFQRTFCLAVEPVQFFPVSEHSRLYPYFPITGLLHFTNGLQGMLLVCFPEGMAKTLVAKMLQTETEEISTSILVDGIGELTNLIAGNSRQELRKNTSATFDQSLPHVIIGTDYRIQRPKGIKGEASLLRCPLGDFFISIHLKRESKIAG